jgi:hypothetical protein
VKFHDKTVEIPAGKRRLRRGGAIVLVAAIGLGGSLALAPGALAANPSLGGLNFAPVTGTDVSPINFTTASSGAKGCPSPATNVVGVINGPTGWTNITALSNTSTNVSNTNDFSLPLVDTFSGIAQANSLTIVPGDYTVTITCQNRLGSTQYGNFSQVITFTSATAYTTTPVVVGTATSTALSLTPTSPQNQGTSLTLTATVTPTATGTVQFMDGSTALGTPQTVASGVATLTTSSLTVGSHSLTAVFTPTSGNGFLGSTSAASTFVVNGVVTPTTTSLSGPSTVAANSPATFVVTTTPTTATGPVTLKEGSTVIGSGTISGGTASIDVTFTTQGAHSVVASFAPTGSFGPSSSQPVAITVGPPPPNTASETIETTIAGGSLTISVADTSTVVLPTPTLDQVAGLLTTGGSIHPVTVTDTRAGAPGFVVSGQVTDFLSGATNKINGYNLGWTPSVVDQATGMTVTPGATVLPAPGVQPGITPTDITKGLKSSRPLASSAAGGLGTTHLGAALALQAPTNTQLGTYDATLTLTAI